MAKAAKITIRNLTRSLWYFLNFEVTAAKGDEPAVMGDIVLGDRDADVLRGEAPPEVTVDATVWAALLASDQYGPSVQAMLKKGDLAEYRL